ncbi:transposase domain-containing protein [Nocardia sp. NPDC057663]|uniref:transposase domain-containing protein n=1 Tax=Nocardia sp. NPDC057663 TaxID=3346201 RepID=UPI00367276B0
MPVPLTDRISLGVLTSWVSRDDVDTVIALLGKQAKRRGGTLPPRVMAYYPMAMALFGDIDDRGSGNLICLHTSITDPDAAPALDLAHAYHLRWQHEQANAEIKTQLRGPGKVLRSRDPDLVRQEIYGYLLAHNAISALICDAATETGLDPHRIKFAATVRIVADHIADPDAFPLDRQTELYREVAALITARRNRNPVRHRSYPRVVKRARHNGFPVKRGHHSGTRYTGPAVVGLANTSWMTDPKPDEPQVTALPAAS